MCGAILASCDMRAGWMEGRGWRGGCTVLTRYCKIDADERGLKVLVDWLAGVRSKVIIFFFDIHSCGKFNDIQDGRLAGYFLSFPGNAMPSENKCT